jgi:hypothetical protein
MANYKGMTLESTKSISGQLFASRTMSNCQHLAHALGPIDFPGCADCGDRSFPSTNNREVSEEGDRELVFYERMSHIEVGWPGPAISQLVIH